MGRRPPLPALVCALALCFLPAGGIVHGDDYLIQIDDTFIRSDGDGWTIGNSLIQYSIGREGQGVGVRSIRDPQSDRDWRRSNGPDAFVVVNGQRVEIGSAATPLVGASVTEWWGGVRLDVQYRYPAASLEITRSYACYPGSSILEVWTMFRATGPRAVTLADLTNFAFAIENGTLHWVRGIGVPKEDGGPFTLASGALDDGQRFEIGSDRRSSEQDMPWFGVSVDDAQFFGSLLWNGSWRFRIERQGDAARLQLGLPSFTTSLGAGGSLESPHAIFGLTNRVVPETSMALRGFIEKGLRHGRPLPSYVSYNTWYSYGMFIDEASVLAEMEMSAALGVELFVIDAGWWLNINKDDPGDFEQEWGNWEVDPDRFPNGLGALSDRAHELGLRFGVWVEPERVARTTVGKPGLAPERILAKHNGRYNLAMPNDDGKSAQICLSDSQARDWVLNKLFEFLDLARPDFVKWDNNLWVNCDRAGHGHGAEDGNFAHHRGLQMVLDQLRERFPGIDIENCASGGNRLSLDMLAYSDVAWIDDHTFPSARVRHNLQGLLGILPAAYLSTFTLSTAEEPVTDDPAFDLRLMLRSRMSGAFGVSWLGRDMSEGTRAALAREIALYKLVRPIMQGGSAFLLSPQLMQTPDRPFTGWDAIEHLQPRTGDAVILAFDTADAPPSAVVRPKGLRPAAIYEVESADYGVLGSAAGADLMAKGIELRASAVSHAHLLILRAR